MKKIYKGLLIATIILLALAAGVYWGISPLAKNYLLKHDKELIGRHIQLSELKINPFSGRVQVENLVVYEKNDSSAFVSLGSFDTQIILYKLLSNEVNIAYTTFDSLNINIEQNKNQFNFDDIIEHFKKTDNTKDTTSKESKPWVISINQTRFERSNLEYHDKALNAHWGIENLAIAIPGISFSNKNTEVGINLNFKTGGKLNLQTDYDLNKGNASLKIDLQNFSIGGLLPYAQEYLTISQISGLLNAKIDVKANLNHLTETSLGGDITLSNASIIDNAQQKMECQNLRVDIAKIDLKEAIFDFNKITIDGLSLPFITERDNTNNFTRLIKTNTPSPTKVNESQQGEKTKMTLLIDEIEFKNGTILVTEKSPSRPFFMPITNISITCKDFNPAAKNRVHLRAALDRSGVFEATWEGRAESISNMSLNCKVSNLNLQRVTPYMVDNFAYPIQKGTCSFSTRTNIRNNQLTSDNKLDIYKLKLGEANKNITPKYKVPLKLGLYILTDVHDKIQIDMPVSGNIKSPDFSYKKALIKAFINLLVKVATTPTRFVSGLISGPSNNLEYIEFNPSSYEFDSENYFKLEEINKIITSKPELILKLDKWPNYQKTIEAFAIADTSNIDLNQKRVFAEQKVKEIDLQRDSVLRVELASRFGFKPDQYVIKEANQDSLQLYKGKSQYKVSFDIK